MELFFVVSCSQDVCVTNEAAAERRRSPRLSAVVVLLPLDSLLSVIYRLLCHELLWLQSEKRFLLGL